MLQRMRDFLWLNRVLCKYQYIIAGEVESIRVSPDSTGGPDRWDEWNTSSFPGNHLEQSIPVMQQFSLQKLAHAIYREFFSALKIGNFIGIKFDNFNRLAQNIDCGFMLELPRRVSARYFLLDLSRDCAGHSV